MSWNESLLADPSPWEAAVEEASAGRWPLSWQQLRALHDPDSIPIDKLPILAWALSVDIWDESWPDEKKRSVVRQSIRDHSIKGTIAGVRRFLSIEDSDLLYYLTPPQRTYASRTLDKDEYDEWLAQMPQLRIYLRSKPGDGRGLAFAGDAFVGDDFAGFDTAWQIYGRFPVLKRGNIITELKTAEVTTTIEERAAVDVEQISVPGIGGHAFAGSAWAGDAIADDEVKEPELYTIALDQSYIHRESALSLNTATPSLDPIRVRFERESEIGNAGPYLFAGDFVAEPKFVGYDQAAWMLYDVLYLHDPEVAAPMVDALSFANHTRVSMPPFNAEFMVDANTQTDNAPAFEGDFVGGAFARREDLTKIERALDAVAISKGYRDKALVTFETTRPRAWSDGLPLDGSVPVWSRVPATL